MSDQPQEKKSAQLDLVEMGVGGVKLTNLQDAYRFAQAVVQSGLAPQGDTAATVLIKLQAGMELGFSPMRALSALHVVKGRLGLSGEACLAKIRASGVCSKLAVGCKPDKQGELYGFMSFTRKDTGETDDVTFTTAEARQAGLMGGDTYKKYPSDMLMWRAVSRGSKRYFSDILMGFDVAEVVKEYSAGELAALPELPKPEGPDPLLMGVGHTAVETTADVQTNMEVQGVAGEDTEQEATGELFKHSTIYKPA